jgi:small ligand-binding sensory domain FIST
VLFDCVGRGSTELGVPLYDVERTIDVIGGGVPVVGVATAGEIATVGAATHHFSYTAAIAVLLRSD